MVASVEDAWREDFLAEVEKIFLVELPKVLRKFWRFFLLSVPTSSFWSGYVDVDVFAAVGVCMRVVYKPTAVESFDSGVGDEESPDRTDDLAWLEGFWDDSTPDISFISDNGWSDLVGSLTFTPRSNKDRRGGE